MNRSFSIHSCRGFGNIKKKKKKKRKEKKIMDGLWEVEDLYYLNQAGINLRKQLDLTFVWITCYFVCHQITWHNYNISILGCSILWNFLWFKNHKLSWERFANSSILPRTQVVSHGWFKGLAYVRYDVLFINVFIMVKKMPK